MSSVVHFRCCSVANCCLWLQCSFWSWQEQLQVWLATGMLDTLLYSPFKKYLFYFGAYRN